MSLSQDQMASLASLAEALKGTTIEDLIKSSIGQAAPKEQTPSPFAPDSAPSKSTETPAQTLTHIGSTQTPAPASASDFLALHTKNFIQRDLTHQKSAYVPSSNKLFYVLNCMDKIMSDNFYVRRALPGFFPTTTRLYIAILFHVQVLRCMKFADNIPYEYSLFLEDFLDSFPPETLPIPGPLLPIFKALTCSVPENKRFKLVYPHHGNEYLTGVAPKTRILSNLGSDHIMPFIPLLAHIHHLLNNAFNGIPTKGADDSHGTGTANVDLIVPPGYDKIIDLLNHPNQAVRRKFFPFPTDRRFTNVANNSTAELTRVDIYSDGNPWSSQTAAHLRSLTNAGIAEPIQVHQDLVKQFKGNFTSVLIPEVDLDNSDFNDTNNVEQFFLFHEGKEWFADLAAQMSSYVTFCPGSGTLGDCSVLGPRVAQYNCQLMAPMTLPANPRFFADPASLTRFDHKLTTTVSEEETITELLARYALVNVRMYSTHPWLSGIGNNQYKSGNFWNIRPIYDQGTTDKAWIQTNQALKSNLLDKPVLRK